MTSPAPLAFADRMPSVAISFGSSGCGLAVLIWSVSGSGADMPVIERTLIAIEEGEFSTFGTRQ